MVQFLSKKARFFYGVFLLIGISAITYQFIVNPADSTSSDPDILGANDSPFAYHAASTSVRILSPVSLDSKPLPSDDFVIEPGIYEWQGMAFDLREGGMYRFIDPMTENHQRIVWNGDVDSFVSAIAWAISHGNGDDDLNQEDLTRAAMHRKLSVTCGYASEWLLGLFGSVGIQARFVSSLTLDEWNSYNNGHSLIEVFRSDHGRWILYDISFDSYFLSSEGVQLSLIEMVEASQNGKYSIVRMSADTLIDVANHSSISGYDLGMISEFYATNQRQLYARVLQVPIIRDNDNLYFTANTEDISRVQSYYSHIIYLPKDEFIDKYYGQ